ncbi:hypothetical protein NPX13_g5179 [Xylaria arbuscula]|uniref:Uncharacterized protein n=1 Tax=Xylaria arbuscula TaxID=114810 RepID=A0A9W8NEV3_9PEZI|nr:hypothetical protein NPX13_g5179 [Xylaria arbuscula]
MAAMQRSPRDMRRGGTLGIVDSLLVDEAGAGPGVAVAVLVDGTLELDAFVVFGMALQDTRDEVVVQGGVGETLAQGILLICQLLGEVTSVGPRVVEVGRVVGVTLVGRSMAAVFVKQ